MHHRFEVKPDDGQRHARSAQCVTFIFSGLAGQAGNPCAVSAPVFDGRRR